MKKFLLFSVVFIFLAGVGWGQAEFTWTGANGTDWGDPGNWEDENGLSVSYPGDGRFDDIVTIEKDIPLPGVLLPGDIKIGDLTISNNSDVIIDTDSYDIEITDALTFYGKITINSAGGKISLNDINGEGDLELDAGTGNITIGGNVGTVLAYLGDITVISANNVTFSGDLFSKNLDVTSAGTIFLNDDVNTEETQTYTGAVTLGGSSPRLLTGTTVTLGIIDGNTRSLTIYGNGVLNGGSGINVLSVSGASTINADITTTGTQTYTGAVTLGGTGDRTLQGTTVTLGSITGGGKSLTISGIGVLNGGSGINVLSVSGASTINADITTTGTQTYTGAVTLGGTGDRTLQGTTVTLGFITGGGKSLTIYGNGILNGGSGINDLSVSGTSTINANITTTGTQTYSGLVTLAGTGTRTLQGTTVNLGRFTGPGAGLSLTISGIGVLNGGSGINVLSVSGASTIDANITTTGAQTYTGAVTLGDNVTLAGTTVNIGAITGGGNSLTITGIGVLNGGSGINVLSVSGASTINADITTTGTQTYTGAVTLGGTGDRTLAGTTVTLGSITGNTRSLTVTGNGVLNGGSGISDLSVSGTSTINVDITTTGTQTYTGAVTLGGDVELVGTTVTLGAITGIGRSLTITGNGVLNGGNNFSSLTVSGTSTINADITTTGSQTYTGAVTLSGPKQTITSNGNILFSNTLGVADKTNDKIELVSNGGNITANGKIEAYQLIAKATGNVTVDEIVIDSNPGNEGINAAIYIEADNFITTVAKPVVPGGPGGQLCLVLNSSWTDTNSVIDGCEEGDPLSTGLTVRWHQHNPVILTGKDLVYGTIPSGLVSGTYVHIEANNVKTTFVLDPGKNIYINDVSITAQNMSGLSFVTSGGFIEFSGTNKFEKIALNTGGGIRLVGADITVTGGFELNNNEGITLKSNAGSSIDAKNIILNNIAAENKENLALKATAGNININGTVGTTIAPIGIVELSATSGNITIGGDTTAYQLIAKAANGTVSVGAVSIDLSTTGYEGASAAIYIVANTFVVTTTTANSIVPGGPGGQLCLDLKIKWTDTNSVVNGLENVRWHQHLPPVVGNGKILYSFTEDSNGNGKLDRIRVQTNVELNGDFSGFVVSVAGYKVESFTLVSAFTLKTPFDNDSFYIYLEENLEIDGGNTPLWSIERNTSLKDTQNALVGNPEVDVNIKPIDTIPPRVAYTLTLPEHPQTYVRMSEPVASFPGTSVSFGAGAGPVTVSAAAPLNLGYLFNYSNPYGVDDLAKLKNIYNDATSTAGNGYFQMSNILDREQEPNWSAITSANRPKYPLNWGYTEYAKVTNKTSNAQTSGGTIPFASVFTPPNKLLTVDMMTKLANGAAVTPNNNPLTRRVTDVLVSVAPTATGDKYFVWPVLVKPSGGSDTIMQFDGTAVVEKSSIEKNGFELQARVSNTLTGVPVLYWTTANIPAGYRNPQETAGAGKAGGLWLPVISNPLYYYVPLSSGIVSSPAVNLSPQLFVYDIAANALAIGGSAEFEFIFRLPNTSDMFAARLDIPSGSVIPANWYTLVRPFAFDIRSVSRQRGGVTILNNVINSNNREVTSIRYHLVHPGRVTVQIYTLDGTLVKSLRRNEQRGVGEWTDTWDGTNNGGRAVARGMYFVRVVGPDIDEIRKIMVVK